MVDVLLVSMLTSLVIVFIVALDHFIENPQAIRGLFSFSEGKPLYDDETNDLKGRLVSCKGKWGDQKVEMVRNGANWDWIYVKRQIGIRDYKVERISGLNSTNFLFENPQDPENSDFIIIEERRNPNAKATLEAWVAAEQSRHLGESKPTSEENTLGFLQGSKLAERVLSAQSRANKREN